MSYVMHSTCNHRFVDFLFDTFAISLYKLTLIIATRVLYIYCSKKSFRIMSIILCFDRLFQKVIKRLVINNKIIVSLYSSFQHREEDFDRIIVAWVKWKECQYNVCFIAHILQFLTLMYFRIIQNKYWVFVFILCRCS